jgi:hypothetical protein
MDPTIVQSPRGTYDAAVEAPTVLTASQYLRQKYGDFSGATMIASPPAPAPIQTHIMGKDALTVGDLKLLQNAIDMELLRLSNLRTVSTNVTIRKSQLEFLGDQVGNVLGAVEREEVKVEEVAIFPANARMFLKMFRVSETLPELFDPEGKSPASIGLVKAPTAATPPFLPGAPTSVPPEPKGRDLIPWVFENIQKLKWSIEADYLAEQAKQREMKRNLNNMEERILSYSYTDTPMPHGYQKLFLEKIRGIEKELNHIPE